MANELKVKNGLIVNDGIVKFSPLTSNGFLVTTGGGGVVSVDTTTYLSSATAATTYQPLDGDLTAIAALSTNGLARRTGVNTWTIDTTAYADTAGSYSNPTWITSLAWSKITGTPTTLAGYNIGDAYTMAQVDALLTGISWKNSVKGATTAALTATYANGTSGVGATLTNSGTQAAFTVDGVTFSVGERVLVKNQAASLQNGIYTVTTVGTGSTNWVLTRATDADSATELDTATVFVERGTTQANQQWTENATVATVGTDAVTFAQISGAGTYTANNGVALSGNVFSAQTQMSVTADSSGIKLSGDSAAPGNTMYYGTNGTGTKGWYAFVGVTDGNKGDITVSSSGSSWTINSAAVTYAKIQNVTATNRILGRFSAGAGSIEEATLSAAHTFTAGALTLTGGLESIAGLAGTTGFLKKTGASTYTLDTSTYLTTESDTLDSVTTRGATTTNDITVGTMTVTNDSTIGTASAKLGSKTMALAAGTNTVLSIAKATYKSLFIDYVLYNGTNSRAGQITVVNDGTNVDFYETTTNDIGNAGSIDTDVVNGTTLDFRVLAVPDATYSIKVIYRYV